MIRNKPVDPVMRIPDLAVDAEHLVHRAIKKYYQFSIDRLEWMRKRQEFYLGWDDYETSSRKGLWEGASNLHLPLTETQCTVMHALIMQAIFFNYPWFYVDPQEDVDVERVRKIERFMKYILERYVNFNKGIYSAIDDWAWDLTTEGMGILSRGWKTLQRRAVVVEENQAFKNQRIDLDMLLEDTEEKDFDRIAKKIISQPYREKSIIRTVFDGPVVAAEDVAYILFKGDVVDATDMDEHETVIKVCYFSEDAIEALKQSEFLDEEAAEKILASPSDRRSKNSDVGFNNDLLRQLKDFQTGVNTAGAASLEEKEYELLCVYDTTKLNPSSRGLSDRLQYFVHPRTQTLARWTFLDRISSNGKIPLHMAHLFRRPRRSTGRGMVQTLNVLNEIEDILVNQTIDSGMLANNPMFGYVGNSTFDPEEVRVEPGLGIKMDNPNTDLRFFQWPINPNWSMPVQGLISSMAAQLTSIGPQASGQVGPQVGPLRSTSGVTALGQLASNQQNILIQRAKICVSGLFEGLYMDCSERMSKQMKISITGQDGVPLYNEKGEILQETIDPSLLSKRVHFGIYANAINMNRELQKQAAMVIAQFSFQPLAIQTGVITPENVYEILANVHQTLGTLRVDRFISRPKGSGAVPLQFEIAMIMQGVIPPIVLNDPEHQAKIDAMTAIDPDVAKQEAQYGKVAANAMEILQAAIKKHQEFLDTLNKPSNLENPGGEQQSPTLGQEEGQVPESGQPPEQQQLPPPAPAPQAGAAPGGGNINGG